MQYMQGVQRRDRAGAGYGGFCDDDQIRLDFYLFLMYTLVNYFGRPFPTKVMVV